MNKMNKSPDFGTDSGEGWWNGDAYKRRLAVRQRAERRFRRLGKAAIGLAAVALGLLLVSIVARSLPAFERTEIRLAIPLAADLLPPGLADNPEAANDPNTLAEAMTRIDFQAPIRRALMALFPDVRGRRDIRDLQALISPGGRAVLRDYLMRHPDAPGSTVTLALPVDDEVHLYLNSLDDDPPAPGRLSANQVSWIKALNAGEYFARGFNWPFFSAGDSREPELAGILGAAVGSFYTMLITLLVTLPLGVAAALYLEEFAPQNRFTDLIEININNLAAVPSIVFGLLGLAVFLNVMHLPRSAPLVGGLTLALMTLPTIIIAGRSALKGVPPSIREAATALGASPLQVRFHHVIPLAMPGILTGTIIGMARALGETAPLLMIGMVAFIVNIPDGINDAATVLPVQVYLWADSPERSFVALTSAAILVLLIVLGLMNGLAVWLRNKYEKRW